METLEGKVVVITGGASGIGLALARAVADRGAVPVIADIERAAFTSALELLPPDTLAVETDVADLQSVEALRDAVLERHGRVDVLCNNAGVSTFNTLADQTIEDWQWVLGVNLWGVIHGVDAFLPTMRSQGGEAHIVNVASVAGLLSGVAFIGPYAASKVAVVSISETLRQEFAIAGDPIGVSVVCPGSTRTNIMSSFRNRPDSMAPEQRSAMGEAMRTGVEASFTGPTGVEPEHVAGRIVDAILDGTFWVVPSDDMTASFRRRFDDILDHCPDDATA